MTGVETESGGPVGELVVLLSEDGSPVGSMNKASVHTGRTPLHLAFSVFAFRPDGHVLVTRRSLAKTTFPGVWTGSCCGHPAPGEAIEHAIVRRFEAELGSLVTQLTPVDPGFRYKAVAPDGLVENELCPIYFGQMLGDPIPAEAEVVEWTWTEPRRLRAAAENAPFAFSPWVVLQLQTLGDRFAP